MSPKSPWNYSNIHLSFEQAHKAYKTLQRYAGEVETAPKAPFEAQVQEWLGKAEPAPRDDQEELYKGAVEKTIARILNPQTEADKAIPLESNLRAAKIFLGFVKDDKFVDDALQRVTKAAQTQNSGMRSADLLQDPVNMTDPKWNDPVFRKVPAFHAQLAFDMAQGYMPRPSQIHRLPWHVVEPAFNKTLETVHTAADVWPDAEPGERSTPKSARFDELGNFLTHPGAPKETTYKAAEAFPAVETRQLQPILNAAQKLPDEDKQAIGDIILKQVGSDRGRRLEYQTELSDHDRTKAGQFLSPGNIKDYLENVERTGQPMGDYRTMLQALKAPHAPPELTHKLMDDYLKLPGNPANRDVAKQLVVSSNPHIKPEQLVQGLKHSFTPGANANGYGITPDYWLDHPSLPAEGEQEAIKYVHGKLQEEYPPSPVLDSIIQALPDFNSLSPQQAQELHDELHGHPNLSMDRHQSEAVTKTLAQINHPHSHEVKLGTSKLRQLRDLIQASGKSSLPPKSLPPGDWSKFRDKSGNISADMIQAHIDTLPGTKAALEQGDPWGGAQRHTQDESNVLLYNLSGQQVQALKDAGAWRSFQNLKFKHSTDAHPHTEDPNAHTVGWVRYTGDLRNQVQGVPRRPSSTSPMRLSDFFAWASSSPAADPKFVDEFQTDLGQHLKDADMPPHHLEAIKQIVFGGKHPGEFLHEAFKEFARTQGHTGPYMTHDTSSKAKISLGRPDEAPPVHMIETYHNTPKKLGMQPAKWAEQGLEPHVKYPHLKEADSWKDDVRKTEEAFMKMAYPNKSWGNGVAAEYTNHQRGYKPEWHKGVTEIAPGIHLHEYVTDHTPNLHTFHITTDSATPIHAQYRPIAAYISAWDDKEHGGLKVDTSVTHPSQQRKGLMGLAYRHLANKHGRLSSGSEQTPEASQLWANMAQDPKFTVTAPTPGANPEPFVMVPRK